MHLNYSREFRDWSRRTLGGGAVQHLDRLGVLDSGWVLAHPIHLEEGEAELLGASGAGCSYSPVSNLSLALETPDLRPLRFAGVAIGVGIDHPNGSQDLWASARTAVLIQRGVAGDVTTWPASDALRLATQEGARALGLDTVTDAAGGKYRAYQDHYQWKCGIAVRDWRYATRIANINITHLAAQSDTQAPTAGTELIKMMSRAIDRIPAFGMCKPVFYMNRTVFSLLRVMAMQKSANALSIEQGLDQFGNPINGNMAFMGIPIRRVDTILNNEAQVV
jgi:hypothetical protein